MSSVCARVFGGGALKVMLTVHTQTAPEESASLVDPLCMFESMCVCVCPCACVCAWFWLIWSVYSGSRLCHFMQEGVCVCGYFGVKTWF